MLSLVPLIPLTMNIQRAHQCTDLCCAGCEECDDDDTEEMMPSARVLKPKVPSGSGGSCSNSDAEDDMAEAAILAKMRTSRASKKRGGRSLQNSSLGTHVRLRDDESLDALWMESDDYAIMLHVGIAEHKELIDWVAQEMLHLSPGFVGVARLVTCACTSSARLPSWLQASSLPAFVTVEKRVVSAALGTKLDQLDELDVRNSVSEWIERERVRLSMQGSSQVQHSGKQKQYDV